MEIFPIGINVENVEGRKREISIVSRLDTILELFKGKKLVVGIDNSSQIKGVIHKLASFHRFLEEYPVWRNKVSFLNL